MDRLFLGLSVSFIFGFARYRFPTVPKWLASSGLAVGVGLLLWALMPFVRTGPALLAIAALVALALAFEWQNAAQPIVQQEAPATPAPRKPSIRTETHVPMNVKATGSASLDMKVTRRLPKSEDKAPSMDRAVRLRQLTNLYVLSHDGISPAMLAGLEYPPAAYLNGELEKLGEPWRARDAGPGKVEVYDLR